MKKTIFSLATLAMIAASCSDEVVNRTPDSQKDIISFSSDGTEGLISGSQTRAGFTSATDMVIRLQSDDRTSTATTKYTRTTAKANADGGAYYSTLGTDGNGYLNRYWDDAHGRNSLLSAYAVAVPNKSFNATEAATKLTATSLEGSDSWAAETSPNNSITWTVTNSTVTKAKIEAEDLTYSNNIQYGGTKGRYVWDYNDGKYKPEVLSSATHQDLGNDRMRFTQSGKLGEDATLGTEAGHFDKGHLHFKHALSRMTIKIIEGDGFDKTSDNKSNDFKWTSGGDIKDKDNNTLAIVANTVGTSGSLNIKTGEWSGVTKGGITTLAPLGTTLSAEGAFSGTYVDAAGYYRAQMLPDYVFDDANAANVLQFTIDNGTFYVTNSMIYNALAAVDANKSAENGWTDAEAAVAGSGTEGEDGYVAPKPRVPAQFKMMQGKNYALEITVKKTGIQAVTATVAPWVDITGATNVNNAHLKFTLATTGTACNKDIDIYRLGEDNSGYNADQYNFDYKGTNWKGNYTDKVELSKDAYSDSNENGYKTKDSKKYWETSWFFESNKTYYHFRTVNHGTVIKDADNDNDDYFEIAGGPQSSTDPHWGAPFKTVAATNTSKPALVYDETNGGFTNVHYAIGATESDINIQEIHMMSNINVVLKTTSDGGKVKLYEPGVAAISYTDLSDYNTTNGLDGSDSEHTALTQEQYDALTDEQKIKTPAVDPVPTIVKITRLATKGKVFMGNGKVDPIAPGSGESYNDPSYSHTMTRPDATSASSFYKTAETETKPYSFAVVPQNLCRVANSTSDDDYVGIFIQTPDHNQYYVIKRLGDILASTVDDQRNQTQGQKIQRWFPGHQYNYSITITKTGITAITATVADWVTVNGQNININLEN